MASPSILRIERLNYGISAVAIVASLVTQPKDVTLGLTVGAVLTCINFFVLRKLIVRWTTQAAQGKGGNSGLLMLPKMVGMFGAVSAAILLLPINVIAFAIGYSIFILSILIETTHTALRPRAADHASENDHG